MIKKLFPGGKTKAFNISYDDGVVQDVRFVKLLNQYGLKGTFNLNSKLLLTGFEWVHECGMTIKRLPESEIVAVYEGHEVASHTATHPMMEAMTPEAILEEMVSDRRTLEKIFGREVPGFALPFSYHDEKIYRCSKAAGFEYARISEENPDFSIPGDFYRWKGSMFHLRPELEACVEDFLSTDTELAICQIIGHSYDLDVADMWDRMEAILRKLSGREDIWSATHIEIVRYLRKMDQAVITKDGIENNSDVDLWFCIDSRLTVLHPGDKEEIR